MSQSTITIRVDKGLKSKFDSLCEAFGLSATAAFNIFIKAVVRERKIPFEIRAEGLSPTRQKAMDAFESLRNTARLLDKPMTLDEINAEIKAVRDERKS